MSGASLKAPVLFHDVTIFNVSAFDRSGHISSLHNVSLI